MEGSSVKRINNKDIVKLFLDLSDQERVILESAERDKINHDLQEKLIEKLIEAAIINKEKRIKNENKKVNIVNSIKRLNRFGDENSKTIKKVKDACLEVSKYIVENDLVNYFPGYTSNSTYLITPDCEIIGENVSRKVVCEFSRDFFQSGVTKELISKGM